MSLLDRFESLTKTWGMTVLNGVAGLIVLVMGMMILNKGGDNRGKAYLYVGVGGYLVLLSVLSLLNKMKTTQTAVDKVENILHHYGAAGSAVVAGVVVAGVGTYNLQKKEGKAEGYAMLGLGLLVAGMAIKKIVDVAHEVDKQKKANGQTS